MHGDADDTVDVEHSRAFAAQAGVALEVVPGGDHKLRTLLEPSPDGGEAPLAELIARVASGDAAASRS